MNTKTILLSAALCGAFLALPVNTLAQRRPQPARNRPAEITAPAPPTTLSPEDALAAMKELQDKGTLVLAVAGEMGRAMGFRFSGTLTKEHCFGWRFAPNKQLIGESSGGYYGVEYTSSALPDKKYQMVGFLDVQTEISVGTKAVAPATYVLYADLNELILDNKAKGLSAEIRLPLSHALDPFEFVNQKNGKSPRYSLALEKSALWLVIGGNKLPVLLTK